MGADISEGGGDSSLLLRTVYLRFAQQQAITPKTEAIKERIPTMGAMMSTAVESVSVSVSENLTNMIFKYIIIKGLLRHEIRAFIVSALHDQSIVRAWVLHGARHFILCLNLSIRLFIFLLYSRPDNRPLMCLHNSLFACPCSYFFTLNVGCIKFKMYQSWGIQAMYYIFLIFDPNTDCWGSLEPPWWGRSYVYLQSTVKSLY